MIPRRRRSPAPSGGPAARHGRAWRRPSRAARGRRGVADSPDQAALLVGRDEQRRVAPPRRLAAAAGRRRRAGAGAVVLREEDHAADAAAADRAQQRGRRRRLAAEADHDLLADHPAGGHASRRRGRPRLARAFEAAGVAVVFVVAGAVVVLAGGRLGVVGVVVTFAPTGAGSSSPAKIASVATVAAAATITVVSRIRMCGRVPPGPGALTGSASSTAAAARRTTGCRPARSATNRRLLHGDVAVEAPARSVAAGHIARVAGVDRGGHGRVGAGDLGVADVLDVDARRGGGAALDPAARAAAVARGEERVGAREVAVVDLLEVRADQVRRAETLARSRRARRRRRGRGRGRGRRGVRRPGIGIGFRLRIRVGLGIGQRRDRVALVLRREASSEDSAGIVCVTVATGVLDSERVVNAAATAPPAASSAITHAAIMPLLSDPSRKPPPGGGSDGGGGGGAAGGRGRPPAVGRGPRAWRGGAVALVAPVAPIAGGPPSQAMIAQPPLSPQQSAWCGA